MNRRYKVISQCFAPTPTDKLKAINNAEMANHKADPTRVQYLLVAFVSIAVYGNSLGCGFVFDDLSAIVTNRDVHGSTPLVQLLTNDYWGTPMHMEHSHKSYRPLSVLSFRLSHAIHGLQPAGYHLANVVLHAAMSASLLRFAARWLRTDEANVGVAPFLCAALFAVHPIHTEAVTGVVGRAELLSGLFVLWALMLSQSESAAARIVSVIFCVLATLSKEQGFMAFALCILINVVRNVPLQKLFRSSDHHSMSVLMYLRMDRQRYVAYVLPAAILLCIRYRLMNGELPVFTRLDNPAASSDAPRRQLTFAYLASFNLGLLLYPFGLCCDWTMGSIPLLDVADLRNTATLLLVAGLLAIGVRLTSMMGAAPDLVHAGDVNRLIVSMAMLILPFIPASNLFFPVGFVVAERVLYLPSVGFCMLVASGIDNLLRKAARVQRWCKAGALVLIVSHIAKTSYRNFDWRDELAIYRSGIRVNPRNAKLFNNVGFAYQQLENYERALQFFTRASQLQPDDIGSWINVGRALNKLSRFVDAEVAYNKAYALLPRRTVHRRNTAASSLAIVNGRDEELRVAPVHLNVFVSLANLITRNNSRLHEADMLYREAIAMKHDYVDAYTNRGEILLKMGRLEEAVRVFWQAVQLKPLDPDVHFNLGLVLMRLDNLDAQHNHTERAAQEFLTVLQIDPTHQGALLSLSMCIQNVTQGRLRRRLVDRVEELTLAAAAAAARQTLSVRTSEVLGGESDDRGNLIDHVWFNLAMSCLQQPSHLGGDSASVVSPQSSGCGVDRAEVFFRRALELRSNFRSALFNLGVLLFEQRRIADAVAVLERLVTWHPDHVKGLMLLADIHMIHRNDRDRAKLFYHQVLRQTDEVDSQSVRYNLCIIESSTEADKSLCSKYITQAKSNEFLA